MEDCLVCKQLGVARIRDEAQDLDSLVICNCAWGEQSAWTMKLPKLSPRILSAFKVGPCPYEWFRPAHARRSVERENFQHEIDQQVMSWTRRIDRARGFWEQWGEIFYIDERFWKRDEGVLDF